MPAAFTLRTPLGGFEREPRGYDDLRRLALRYAKDELAGRTLCNHATQLAITLSPAALAAATRPGAPSALLWAIPDLPALLSHALYVRTVADPRRRPDIRRVHLLAARAEIAGRPAELLFAVRETFGGQCFLDRVSERGTSARGRQDGGEVQDDAGTNSTTDAGDQNLTSPQPVPNHPAAESDTDSDGRTLNPKRVRVTVNNFYDEALGFGHVGLAVGDSPSLGFYPADESILRYPAELRGNLLPGIVKQDDMSQPHYSVELDVTPDEARKISNYIRDRAEYPGPYELYLRQCTDFVRSALAAGGLKTNGDPRPNHWFQGMFSDQYNKGNVPQD
ncbi:MAG TPA: hypothetical protein VEI03_14150 [Stellaceae bacterium]|nr:hypothetical protein [Stellaceae bacterium]